MGQKYKLRKTDVFGQCLMFSGNVSCHRAMSHVFGPYVFGQCLMFSGNISCHRAVCFRAMSHVIGRVGIKHGYGWHGYGWGDKTSIPVRAFDKYEIFEYLLN